MMGISAPNCDPSRHAWSSTSTVGSPAPAFVHAPVVGSIASQYSKWPISSDAPTLVVCAPQVEPRGTAELYIGWNAYGATWHVLALGWNRMCPKPLAMLAVIEPCWPVVRSLMSTR